MKKNTMTLMAAGTCAMIAASASNAAVVAGWSFTGLSGYGASPLTATSSDANVTVGGLTRGSGIGTSGTAAGSAWGGSMAAARVDAAAAITASQFATFTVTAVNGYTVSFSQIDTYNVRRSGSGPASGQWQYAKGAGSYINIGSALSFTGTSGTTMSAVDLSGISGLQSVAAGSAVTFRMVMYANSGTGTFYFQNGTGSGLSVSGTTAAIPAPGAVALIGLAGLVASRRRRN